MEIFPVIFGYDLDDLLVNDSNMVDNNPSQLKERKDGNHMMTPFQ